jgi:DNA-binding NarL/FixJ family response regulator
VPIRVLVADDHPLIRAGLAALLANEPDLELVGEARDGREAVLQSRALRPDVILMDLSMPGVGGLAAIRAILGPEAPGTPGGDGARAANDGYAGPPPRILVLTVHADEADIRPALAAGAAAYLLKDMAGAQVADAIRAVAGARPGGPFGAAAPAAFAPRLALDAEELELLARVAGGRTIGEIARTTGRTEGTVDRQLRVVYAKLGAVDGTAAVAVARARGILPLG